VGAGNPATDDVTPDLGTNPVEARKPALDETGCTTLGKLPEGNVLCRL